MSTADTTTVGRYLVRRLEQYGLKHVFGVPGDYVLSFCDEIVDSEMDYVGTCTEIGAGYAADAYARVNGMGCLCVTYCVGGLNAVNAVAGAYAEKAPVVVISGAPGLGERRRSNLLHHQIRDFHTQLQIYEKVTVDAVALEDPDVAPELIDRALSRCMRLKRPVYIELPRDVVDLPCPAPKGKPRLTFDSDADALAEAIDEAATMVRKAKRPVVLAGVEVHRFGLQASLLQLVERTGLPVAAALLGKSVISEHHPSYIGVYEGAMGRDAVRRTVEASDCLLVLGAFMTDINMGIWTADLDESKTINATSERIRIRRHYYDDVYLGHFIDALAEAPVGKRRANTRKPAAAPKPMKARNAAPVTVRRFFKRMNEFLGEGNIVICDIGDSLFGAAELTIHRRTEFLSPAYYTSMGYATPAAIGAQVRDRKLRPIVFVGDGAFQMTGGELSTIAKLKLNPIIFVLNNDGYTTERLIHEGPYNNIHQWNFHRMPELLGAGMGFDVRTEGELESALAAAERNQDHFSILNIHLDRLDHSEALERLGKRLGASVK